MRWGQWKYHLPLEDRIMGPHLPDTEVGEARLYDLSADISETQNVVNQHLDIVEKINELIKKVRGDMKERIKGQQALLMNLSLVCSKKKNDNSLNTIN